MKWDMPNRIVPIIVSGREFRDNLSQAWKAVFRLMESKWFFLNRAAVLKKE